MRFPRVARSSSKSTVVPDIVRPRSIATDARFGKVEIAAAALAKSAAVASV
jgi:hypothetical protein